MRAAILAAQKPTAIDLDALRTSESESILSQLVASRARLLQHSEMALELGDVKAAVSVESKIVENLALVGKLLGQLVTRHDVRHSSIMLTPDYLRIRQALVAALRPFPEAARAVGAALHAIESDAAKEITAAAGKPMAPVIEHEVARPLPPPPC